MTSSFSRLSEEMVRFSAITTLSRNRRALAFRRMMPDVTRQPAMLPTFDERKIARMSARPSSTSS